MGSRRALHPLLLEPTYWRNRLQEQKLVRRGTLITPRPDLSCATVEVQEIKFKAHDGVRLWGLMARCPMMQEAKEARIRVVGPAHPAEIEAHWVRGGSCEFVFQELAGRRLEDRVLDVLQVCELAASIEGIDRGLIRLDMATGGEPPDELLIAAELRAGGITG